MKDFSNIVDHPDYQEIIRKLVVGDNSKDISQWLKVKYTDKDQRHLQLSAKSIQDFVEKHVNLMDHVQSSVAIAKGADDKLEKKIAASLMNNKTYRERVLEITNNELDIKKMIAEFLLMARDRMEQVFDNIQANPAGIGKGDYVLLKYMETLFLACEKFDKIVNQSPDQIIQHNYTVQVMEQNVAVFQEAVRKTLAQMDTEASLQFVEILTEELKRMKSTDVGPTVEGRMLDAQILRDMPIPE